MNATMNGTPHSRPQRKSLTSQLDRLDSIIDALDVGLSGAVKDAVATAVSEAVRATILEIVTNPDMLVLLRGLHPASNAPELSPNLPGTHEKCPSIPERKPSSLSQAWLWCMGKLKAGGKSILDYLRATRAGIIRTYDNLNAIWRMKRSLLIAGGVGVVIGTIGYFASPWLAGVLSGIGALGTTLGIQLAVWAKRLFGGFTLSR